MKKKWQRLLMVSAMIFPGIAGNAQVNTSLHGIVKEMKGGAVGSVTVSLLRSKDSLLVKLCLSDQEGNFEMSGAFTGHFLLCYSAVGFVSAFSDSFELSAGQIFNAPVVYLNVALKQLEELTIKSKKPLVQVKTDMTVFNVQNSINATGSNALELLQKSPGITVDNNENISIRGKLGVRISVDGKMIQLASEDLAAYLKSMNSNDIEAIEIIHNPGARYDASGNAGIINIRLRKNSNEGINASMTAGIVQGTTPKGNASVSMNYRNSKMNIFANAGFNYGRSKTDIIAPRTQKDTTYAQRLLQLSYGKSFTMKAGVDYFIDPRQTIGVMTSSNFNNEDWASYGHTAIYFQPTNAYIKKLDAVNSIPRKRTNVNTNLNYRFADTSGREINFDADYGLFRGRANSYQPNYYTDSENKFLSGVITRNNTPTDIDIYTSRLDITIPGKKSKLEFGARVSYVKTNNTLDFFNDILEVPTKIDERSYHFIYKENVNAVYVAWQKQFDLKWSLQTAARVEQTHSRGIFARADGIEQPDSHVEKNYLDLFPNAILSFVLNSSNSFNLSYNRRIERPNYQILNPFELKLDELSYVKGNSFLRPQYANNIELSHIWKGKVNSSIGYSHVTDFTTQTVDTFKNFTYALAKNLATQDITTLNIHSPISINKWWNAFLNIWVNYQVFKGKVNENNVLLNFWGYGAFMQQTFTLGNDYSAELSGWFNGPSPLGPTLISRSMGGLDLGFQKVLLHGRGTIRISGTDILRTAVPFRATTDFGGLVLNFWVTRESRTARLSFTYRFGNSKIKGARNRESGLENESKRIVTD